MPAVSKRAIGKWTSDFEADMNPLQKKQLGSKVYMSDENNNP